METKSKSRKIRRSHDDEDIDRGDAMLRITDYSGAHDSTPSGPRSILVPHSPRSPKPMPSISAITEEEEEMEEERKEEEKKEEEVEVVRRKQKTKKIRSNSIIQTDV